MITWTPERRSWGWASRSIVIGGSCIVAPTGEIVAQCTSRDDELISADCDLDLAEGLKQNLLNFAVNRQIHAYGPITSQAGITPPPDE